MRSHDTLRGERLVLRDYDRADMDFGLMMWLDEENGRYLSDPTAEAADERYFRTVEGLAEHPAGYFFIAEHDGVPVGSCFAYPQEGGVCEVAYCVRKDRWRQGYGYEMLMLLIGWIHARGFGEVRAEAALANDGSNALLRKAGFAPVGESTYRKRGVDGDQPSRVYSLVLEEAQG